ncbi:HdeD family acid-resistance protein [Xylanibacter caecicola]|nr:DUF308 domain-containing protein [Xylanibacter caecicola]
MMKVLQSSIFRAICAIIVGILLIKNPDDTVKGITIATGVLFLLSGVISCAVYFSAKISNVDEHVYDASGRLIPDIKPAFPVVGLGSILFGIILALIPETFIQYLMYFFGAIIIFGALNQFINLAQAKRRFGVPLVYWFFPSITLIAGCFIILNPIEAAGLPMLVIGCSLIFYGITDGINAFKINRLRKTQNNL